MHRTPKLKDQAQLLAEALKAKGIEMTRGESLEMVARMNGFASWNVASAAQSPAQPQPGQGSRLRTIVWTATHHHRHGVDVFNFFQKDAPSEEEVIAQINAVSSYEPEYDEYFEVSGPDELTLEPGADGVSEWVAVPNEPMNLVRIYEVNMTEHFEYDVPEELAEWQWIEANGRFAHIGNAHEPGVWEFMVRCELGFAEGVETPDALRPAFNKAKELGATWILFYQ